MKKILLGLAMIGATFANAESEVTCDLKTAVDTKTGEIIMSRTEGKESFLIADIKQDVVLRYVDGREVTLSQKFINRRNNKNYDDLEFYFNHEADSSIKLTIKTNPMLFKISSSSKTLYFDNCAIIEGSRAY